MDGGDGGDGCGGCGGGGGGGGGGDDDSFFENGTLFCACIYNNNIKNNTRNKKQDFDKTITFIIIILVLLFMSIK